MRVPVFSAALLVLAALFCLMLSACAGNRPEDAIDNERFTTATGSAGQRLFTYSVTMKMGHGNGGNGHRPGGEPGEVGPRLEPAGSRDIMGPDPATLAEMFRPRVYDLLHARLDETGYCPGGYRVLESRFGPDSEIRGECIEQAE